MERRVRGNTCISWKSCKASGSSADLAHAEMRLVYANTLGAMPDARMAEKNSRAAGRSPARAVHASRAPAEHQGWVGRRSYVVDRETASVESAISEPN